MFSMEGLIFGQTVRIWWIRFPVARSELQCHRSLWQSISALSWSFHWRNGTLWWYNGVVCPHSTHLPPCHPVALLVWALEPKILGPMLPFQWGAGGLHWWTGEVYEFYIIHCILVDILEFYVWMDKFNFCGSTLLMPLSVQIFLMLFLLQHAPLHSLVKDVFFWSILRK